MKTFKKEIPKFHIPALGLGNKNMNQVICGIVNALEELRGDVSELIENGDIARCAYSGKLVNPRECIAVFLSDKTRLYLWIGALEDIYWDETAFDSDADNEAFHRAVIRYYMEIGFHRQEFVSLLRYAPIARVAHELGFRHGVKFSEMKCAALIPQHYKCA